ncbi:MAG: hypothetical protein AAF961_14180, partial [Planctomycetota bacterium]
TNKDLLHLALLLHDLGKGSDEDHCRVGGRIAAEMSERLSLNEQTGADLYFLVRRHLTMSHLAFRRDTNDPDVLASFVNEVASVERLRMLFTLTCADLAAVGPDVLSQWKVEVLTGLYQRAKSQIEDVAPQETGVAEHRERIWAELSPGEQSDDWFRRQTDVLSTSYFARREPRRIAESLRRFRNLEPRTAVAWGLNQPDTKTVEFIAGVDQGPGRGMFASMAGALSSHGFQILAANSEVLADNLLVLNFVALDPDSSKETPEDRLAAVCQSMVASVDRHEPPKFRRVWGQDHAERSVKLTALPNDVRIDNNASSNSTVVEVFTFDRVGLLYFLARKLHELGLTIQHAKIGTYLDQVVDVFYVTNRDGEKIAAESEVDDIRREVLSIIGDEQV